MLYQLRLGTVAHVRFEDCVTRWMLLCRLCACAQGSVRDEASTVLSMSTAIAGRSDGVRADSRSRSTVRPRSKKDAIKSLCVKQSSTAEGSVEVLVPAHQAARSLPPSAIRPGVALGTLVGQRRSTTALFFPHTNSLSLQPYTREQHVFTVASRSCSDYDCGAPKPAAAQ